MYRIKKISNHMIWLIKRRMMLRWNRIKLLCTHHFYLSCYCSSGFGSLRGFRFGLPELTSLFKNELLFSAHFQYLKWNKNHVRVSIIANKQRHPLQISKDIHINIRYVLLSRVNLCYWSVVNFVRHWCSTHVSTYVSTDANQKHVFMSFFNLLLMVFLNIL